ncbi:MAG: hypothetical protein WC378_15635 [Opitutaceae bacterium]|jgi:hypothetical protein
MAANTFGLKLYVWDTSVEPDAYTEIKHLTDISPPSKKADEPADSTNHSSASGVREYTPTGTFTYTDVQATMNDEPADAGQLLLPGMVGTVQKFQLTLASAPAAPVFFNAEVISFESGANPLNGVAIRTLNLKPTGVPPVS